MEEKKTAFPAAGREAAAEGGTESGGGGELHGRRRFPTVGDMLALLGIALGAQIVVGTAAMLFMLFAGHGFDYKSMEPTALGKLMAALYFCSMSITLAGILYYRRARGGSGPWARFSARGLNPALLLWAFVLIFAVGVVLEPLLRLMPSAATPSRGSPTPVTRKPTMAGHTLRPATCPIYTGKIRFPAPKNIPNSVPATRIFCRSVNFLVVMENQLLCAENLTPCT